ncbi:NAD(P)H-dependent oxidoreductase [Saccharicrinis aurantiacus]|uniref:NAD(P)H-dependent oxidoreductase n=1 Tax=Saccharicrinis aurantiacus TaxID=1849719 RepID=UPI0009F88A81|nr:NAD(P)H-dependent oxidoreductase [Saccharicrinis aurantiacus]
MKVLILFAHPAFHKSNVNKVMVDGLSATDSVTFHDLYQAYPDFDIDIEREQELLSQHDCVIFHYPFFWYSNPALLKEWQDLVLTHGWAFGSKGNMLKGKLFFTAITAGGPKASYTNDSFNGYTIQQLIAPLLQSAMLCKMITLPPFIVYGTHAIELPEVMKQKRIYSELLRQLAEDEFEVEAALEYEDLNDYITHKMK